mmetsp:Transcript_28347/g.50507  ORF Transcript_28347/g.50507 Transcript_28347/m.50507 type:complete len:1521 (+) Transcript_28347:395-4957(+)
MEPKQIDVEDLDQLDIFSFEDKRTSIVAEAFKSFKIALMGTLFIMAEETSVSFKVNLVSMIIDTLQILSYPFNQDAKFPWNPAFSDWFVWLCNSSQMEFYISEEDPLQNLIIYLILILIVALNLLNAAFVGYRYSRNLVQNVFLLKILRSVTSLLTTVLFQPILSQFVFIFACSTESLDSPGCPTVFPELLMVSSILTTLTFGLLSFVVAASFYEQDFHSEDVTARPHARLELYYLGVKALLTLQFKLFTAPSYHLFGVISNLGFSISVAYLYIFYLPFYHYHTTVIQAKFAAIYVWSSICLAVCVIENDTRDAGPVMIFFIGSVCVWILTESLCEWRANRLGQKTPKTCKNVLEVELATRFKLINQFKTLRVDVEDNEEVINWVEEFYYEAERIFPESSMLQLFAAQFYLTYRDSVSDAVVKIEKAEQLKPRLDEQFIIYKRKQDFTRSSVSDTITFVTFNSHLQSAHRAETVALTNQLIFWNELLTLSVPNFEKMTLLSANISQNIGEGRQHYDTLMKLNSNHPKMLRMHAFFLQDVLNELDQTRSLLNRAQNLEEKKEDKLYGGQFEGEAVDAYFELSIDRSNIGVIEKCNALAINMLKVPKSSLINNYLGGYILPPFDSFFSLALLDLIEGVDASAPLPPIDSFFLDSQGCLIPVVIRLDMNLEMNSSPRKTTNRSNGSVLMTDDIKSLRDSALNSEASLNSFSSRRPSGIYESTKAHVVCRVAKVTDQEIIIVLNQDYKILRLTRDASSLIGLEPNSQLQPSIKEYLSGFEGHIEMSRANAIKRNDGSLLLAPIQTFILSSWGKFVRVKLSFEEKTSRRMYILIVRVKLLPEFSKPTQRFFSLMAEFLRFVLTQKGKDNIEGLKNLSLAEMLKQETEIEDQIQSSSNEVAILFRRIRTRVKKANETFSPELQRVNNIFKLFSLMILGLYVGQYATSEIKFKEYLGDIEVLRSATNLQTCSLELAVYTRLLDMERRGIVLVDDLSERVYTLADDAEGYMNDINDADIDKFDDKDVLTISYDSIDWYTVKPQTILEASTTQTTNAQRMTELPDEEVSIRQNSLAFWVHENGRLSLYSSLKTVATQLRKIADDTRSESSTMSVIFLIFEVCLACCLIVIALPSLQKSDHVHLSVISVFYNIPFKIMAYLQANTKLNLSMMQHENYPDNKIKAEQSNHDLDELRRMRSSTDFEVEDRFSRKREELGIVSLNFWFKFKLLLRNSIFRRVLAFSIITILYSIFLQVLIGQIMALNRVVYAAKLTEYVGYLTVSSHISFTELMDCFDAPTPEEVLNDNIQLQAKLNGTYTLESIEESYAKLMKDVDDFRQYMNLVRVGDDDKGIPYSYINDVGMMGTYDVLFKDGCVTKSPADCSTFFDGVMSEGIYIVVEAYCDDISFAANSIYNDFYDSEFDSRWKAHEDLAIRIVKLNREYLSPALEAIERAVINFFLDELDFFEKIRVVFLALWIIFNLFYYVFIMRRAVLWHEKKKKLVREMLLLLPFPVIKSSIDLQMALNCLDLN